jgi:hypothetical protein
MSSLERSIEASTRLLREGRLPNEQAVSQSVVLRILGSLGWEVYDPAEVWPEYATGEGRVDFALCHPPSKPKIFVEVKQPGRATDGVRQALQYAFTTGVPFVVLTDGQTWSFYLPAEQGSYDDRRVYMVDLYEHPDAAAEVFRRFLSRDQVASDNAIEHARAEYRRKNRREQARSALVLAWRDLADSGDQTLVDLLASAVESRVGFRPDLDDVANYLRGLGSVVAPGQSASRAAAASVKDAQVPTPPSATEPGRASESFSGGASAAGTAAPGTAPFTSSRAGIARVLGASMPYQNAKEAMVIVLRTLASSDTGFLERLSRHPKIAGRTRRYVARSSEELYPEREDLREFAERLPGDWLVATNLNNLLKGTIIRAACEVAGLAFGRDVVVDL